MNNYVPRILYKYRSSESGINILLNLSLWFSSPNAFQDKNDAYPKFQFIDKNINSPEKVISSLEKMLIAPNFDDSNIVKIYGKDFIKNSIKQIRLNKNPEKILYNIFSGIIQKDLRILSLCETYSNNKMWQEYADNYKGVVIGIKTSRLLEDKKFLFKVVYETEKHFPINLNGSFYDYFSMSKLGKNNTFKLFYTKDYKYCFENEYRFMFFVNAEKASIIKSCYGGINYFLSLISNIGCAYPILKDDIDSVYLGEKINILDELQIYYYVNKNLKHVKLYKYYHNTSLKKIF